MKPPSKMSHSRRNQSDTSLIYCPPRQIIKIRTTDETLGMIGARSTAPKTQECYDNI
jgi:hypothetical protein